MITIRVLLIVALVVLFAWFLRQRMSTKSQAWSKLGALLFALVAVVSVLFPESTNTLAHKVGVGRGADLLLYGLTVMFLADILLQYIHRQDDSVRIDDLARRLAIIEANNNPTNKRRLKRLGHKPVL